MISTGKANAVYKLIQHWYVAEVARGEVLRAFRIAHRRRYALSPTLLHLFFLSDIAIMQTKQALLSQKPTERTPLEDILDLAFDNSVQPKVRARSIEHSNVFWYEDWLWEDDDAMCYKTSKSLLLYNVFPYSSYYVSSSHHHSIPWSFFTLLNADGDHSTLLARTNETWQVLRTKQEQYQ